MPDGHQNRELVVFVFTEVSKIIDFALTIGLKNSKSKVFNSVKNKATTNRDSFTDVP